MPEQFERFYTASTSFDERQWDKPIKGKIPETDAAQTAYSGKYHESEYKALSEILREQEDEEQHAKNPGDKVILAHDYYKGGMDNDQRQRVWNNRVDNIDAKNNWYNEKLGKIQTSYETFSERINKIIDHKDSICYGNEDLRRILKYRNDQLRTKREEVIQKLYDNGKMEDENSFLAINPAGRENIKALRQEISTLKRNLYDTLKNYEDQIPRSMDTGSDAVSDAVSDVVDYSDTSSDAASAFNADSGSDAN